MFFLNFFLSSKVPDSKIIGFSKPLNMLNFKGKSVANLKFMNHISMLFQEDMDFEYKNVCIK